ncbi:nitroreductase family protein [Candidatus Nitrospira neomarina]|uniref:Nitroreductase family protein n=1 Tax=Candidatus Nitrospira neomarina TaxID=3020899 RepID=A0AA96GNE8_9BACT|nr:nitroreductase family protein [Candidatus Nitrospira neomarina]WNM64082.1 nitroreductase family protein [Candidatus Nitrospira neomarina]
MDEVERSQSHGAEFKLRRNIHRLEKGLIMRPRRDDFALDYIAETVVIFDALSNRQRQKIKKENELLLKWAHDVLDHYFSITREHPTIVTCKKKFRTINLLKSTDRDDSSPFCPYTRKSEDIPDISINQLHKLAQYRRSCRWYLQKPVSRAIIDQAMEVAMLSPSACNRQPFRFIIFDNQLSASDVGSIPMGTIGFSQNFPAIAVIVGQLDAFSDDRDRHVIYIDSALAAMAFQFALEVQGVSSCCINWPDIEAREKLMEKRLGLAKHERPILSISFGYADPKGQVPYSQKKALDEIRIYAQ